MSRLFAIAAAFTLMATALPAGAGDLAPPEPGHSLVMLALSDKAPTLDQVVALLKADPKTDDETRANPEKLKARAQKLWVRMIAGDYVLIPGLVETPTQQVLPNGRFRMIADDMTGRRWLVADMPAGDAVLFTFTVQGWWQLRFDGASPHFKTGQSPYILLGSLDAHANQAEVIDAVHEGELPAQSQRTLLAVCGEKVRGYTPPGDPDTLAAANAFIEHQLNHSAAVTQAQVTQAQAAPAQTTPAQVTSADVMVAPFVAKKTYNIVVATGFCMTTLKP